MDDFFVLSESELRFLKCVVADVTALYDSPQNFFDEYMQDLDPKQQLFTEKERQRLASLLGLTPKEENP